MKLLFAIGVAFSCASLLLSVAPCAAQPKSGMRERTPIDPAAAEKEGRELVQDLLSQKPAENLTNTGVLRVRVTGGGQQQTRVSFQIASTPTNWFSVYEAAPIGTQAQPVRLTVVHTEGQPNTYLLSTPPGAEPRRLSGAQAFIPFAGSDFWLADLGLEFLHWGKQRVIGTEMRRGQSCQVLESINPGTQAGAYSRVVSWIDIDSGGIVHADAYDAKGRLLKQFDPKRFKKVDGQWQLQEMEIYNRQKNSRTWIEFHLDDPPAATRQ